MKVLVLFWLLTIQSYISNCYFTSLSHAFGCGICACSARPSGVYVHVLRVLRVWDVCSRICARSLSTLPRTFDRSHDCLGSAPVFLRTFALTLLPGVVGDCRWECLSSSIALTLSGIQQLISSAGQCSMQNKFSEVLPGEQARESNLFSTDCERTKLNYYCISALILLRCVPLAKDFFTSAFVSFVIFFLQLSGFGIQENG
jgi:hypothetical protein